MTFAKDPQLAPFSDAELVQELVARNGYDKAPARTIFSDTARVTLIATSPDTTARLVFHEGDLGISPKQEPSVRTHTKRAPVTPRPRSSSNVLPRET